MGPIWIDNRYIPCRRETTMFNSAINALKQALSRAGPPRLSDEELFQAYFDAEDWPATTQLLDFYSDRLFTDQAQSYLMTVRKVCVARDMRFLTPIVDERRHLLTLCRMQGDSSPVSSFPSHTRRQAFLAVTEQADEYSVPAELQIELLQGFLHNGGAPERWNMLYGRLLSRSEGENNGAAPADQMLQLAQQRHERATFLHYELERYAEAMPWYEAAIEICGELGYVKGLCLNTFPAGVACMELGKEAEALELFKASIDYAKRCNYLPQIIQSQRLLGKRLLLAHRDAEARNYLLGSLQLALAAFELDEALLCAAQVGAIGTRRNDVELLLFAHKTIQEIKERRQHAGAQ